jgi:hypothetical protein
VDEYNDNYFVASVKRTIQVDMNIGIDDGALASETPVLWKIVSNVSVAKFLVALSGIHFLFKPKLSFGNQWLYEIFKP